MQASNALRFEVNAPANLPPGGAAVMCGNDAFVTCPDNNMLRSLLPPESFGIQNGNLPGGMQHSVIEGMLGDAAAVTAATPPEVKQSLFSNMSVTPKKYDAILTQLVADGLPVKRYADNSTLGRAVQTFVQTFRAPAKAAYVLTRNDMFQHEIVFNHNLAPIPNFVDTVLSSLTFHSLAGPGGFLKDYGILAFSVAGRSLIAGRDSPGTALYDLAHSVAVQGAKFDLPPSSTFPEWLKITRLPIFMFDMSGPSTGSNTRHIGAFARRWHLAGHGEESRLRSLIGDFISSDRAAECFPLIHKVTQGEPPMAAIAICDDLLRETTPGGASSLRIKELAGLATLERNLGSAKLKGVFDNPTLFSASSHDFVGAIVEAAKTDAKHERSRRGANDTAVNSLADDNLTAALRTPKYYAFKLELEILLDSASQDTAAILLLCANAPVLEVRRHTLSYSLAALSSRCTALARAAEFVNLDNFTRVLSLGLLAKHLNIDVWQLPSADKIFRLDESVVKRLLSMQFSKINWVREISAVVVAFNMRPHHVPNVPEPYLDSATLEILILLVPVISNLLGLKTEPPDNADNWFSLQMLWSELRSIVMPLQLRRDAAALDERKIAGNFIELALSDATAYLAQIFRSANPDGLLPSSVLAPDAPSIGELLQARNLTALSLQYQRNYPQQTQLLQRLGEREAALTASEARAKSDRRYDPKPHDSTDAGRLHSGDSDRRMVLQKTDIANTGVILSTDGDGFCYCDKYGDPKSMWYSFSLLEAAAARSREDLDFPYILSNRTDDEGKMSKCQHQGKPGHESAHSSAHIGPKNFSEMVHSRPADFAMPTGRGAPSSAYTPSPGRSRSPSLGRSQ